jgi:hypothetical protein
MFGMTIIAEDSLMNHNGMQFSTRDEDHDTNPHSCSVNHHGSWWYYTCHEANLNGRYYKNGETPKWAEGITWKHWKGYTVSLKSVTMQMRPARFSRGEEFSLHRTPFLEYNRCIRSTYSFLLGITCSLWHTHLLA